MNDLKIVGKSINKIDAKDKVDGRAIYPQDIYLENMAFGITIRSTRPHAFIKVDTKEAEKIDGVIKVFTYKDVPGKTIMV
ncbi:hypothetical protein [Caloramator sp. Dgby_cultured_2]|uniref:hypothetical protein n=1 Tax=Caloramator sp. Dgby_cultured_2 TaxID=3029174 RepID=UPI0031587C29